MMLAFGYNPPQLLQMIGTPLGCLPSGIQCLQSLPERLHHVRALRLIMPRISAAMAETCIGAECCATGMAFHLWSLRGPSLLFSDGPLHLGDNAFNARQKLMRHGHFAVDWNRPLPRRVVAPLERQRRRLNLDPCGHRL